MSYSLQCGAMLLLPSSWVPAHMHPCNVLMALPIWPWHLCSSIKNPIQKSNLAVTSEAICPLFGTPQCCIRTKWYWNSRLIYLIGLGPHTTLFRGAYSCFWLRNYSSGAQGIIRDARDCIHDGCMQGKGPTPSVIFLALRICPFLLFSCTNAFSFIYSLFPSIIHIN